MIPDFLMGRNIFSGPLQQHWDMEVQMTASDLCYVQLLRSS